MRNDWKHSSNTQILGHGAAGFTAFIWGTTFIATKVLLRAFSPVEILLIRFVIGLLTLFCMKPVPMKLGSFQEEATYAVTGLTGISIYYLLENIALQHTTTANVGIIVSTAPFFVALFSCLILKEKWPGMRFYVGLIIAMFGIVVLNIGEGGLQLHLQGDALALLASAVWGVYSALVKKIESFGKSTILNTRRIFAYGTLFMLPIVGWMGFRVEMDVLVQPVYMANFAYLGIGACAICFVSWNLATRYLGPVQTSAYIYAVPAITILTAGIVLHEQITGSAVVGMLLCVMGLLLSQEKKKFLE